MPPPDTLDRPGPLPLAVHSLGDGPPVLFLHGLFGSGRIWRSLAAQLASEWRCLLVDLRGHGSSPKLPPLTYPAMAEDLCALLDREGLAEAALVGHSMGGKVAMTLALAHPERVPRLAVLDIAPVAYAPERLAPIVDALRALKLDGIRRRADADRQLAAAIPDPAVRGFLLTNLQIGPEGARWRLDLALIREFLPELSGFPEEILASARYSGPALFLHGARSDYVRDAHRAAILGRFPRARLEQVPGAGHWLHWERPRQVVERLRRFLNEPDHG